MTPDAPKKNGQGEPDPGTPSESGSTMKPARNGPPFDPRGFPIEDLRIEDLKDLKRAEEALARWDELEPALLTAIERHPQHGARLQVLRRAERWLGEHGSELRAAGPCPSSEELYDFGRGPGFGPLTADRRNEIDAHLRRCADCEGFVETLAAPPPVPLELPQSARRPSPANPAAFPTSAETDGRSTSPIPSSPIPTSPTLTPTGTGSGEPSRRTHLRKLPRLVPLAVAASVILALGIWYAVQETRTSPTGFPGAPLLRGSSTSALLFPRDRVLHATEAVKAAFPALNGSVGFELEPVDGAEGYAIDVARHGKDAFATEEKKLFEVAATSPMVRTDASQASVLTAGDYTWTARAKVRGLDEPLGQRDFSMVDDPALCEELLGLAGRSEPEKSLAAVQLLHSKGFLTDARAVARAMPASPERDAYLERARGR
jgi:hypothetical protein